MRVPVNRKMLTAAVAVSIAMLLPGCIFGPKQVDNGLSSAQFASDEVSNMGVDAGNVMAGAGVAGLGKAAAAQTETTYIDWTVHPYAWDSVSQSYVRTAMFATSRGYDRTRIDTITFFDNSGNKLRHPTLATVASMHHVRHVTHSKNGIEANVVFDMTNVLNKGADTTLVKNGTMRGTYGDEVVASGTVSNVTRKYANGVWQFPESGSADATFPRHTFAIEFLGGGMAKVTLHNLTTDKVTIINIMVDQR